MLKLMAGGAILAAGAGAPNKLEAAGGKDVTSKIVIMGAGLAGISLAARLRKDAPNAKIILVDKEEKFYYQPGFTLVGIGFYTRDDVTYEKKDLIPSGCEWVKQNVKSMNPGQNSLTLDDGSNLNYDYLVIATGVAYKFEHVDGLSYDDILNPDNVITSNYVMQGSEKTFKLSERFAKAGGRGIFAEPRGAMKCAGANKKVMFMYESRTRQLGTRDKASLQLFGGGPKVFSNPVYAETIETLMAEKGIDYSTDINHELDAVDKARNIATFKKYMPYTENGEKKMATDFVEAKFDWMHYTPKQIGLQMFVDAGLTDPKDPEMWVDVNRETLQSKKYKNIFAIGDVCGVPMGKTGASVRKMYPIVANNLIAQIKGEALPDKFDGYTACPLLCEHGKAMMVEFNWAGVASSMPCFGATRASYLSWLTKLYAFRPMIMRGMINAIV